MTAHDRYRPEDGDRVRVTRTTRDGHRTTWVGVISCLLGDPPGFRLDWPGGASFFADSAVLAADPFYPILQTLEPAPVFVAEEV